jgi:hypothetical protein
VVRALCLADRPAVGRIACPLKGQCFLILQRFLFTTRNSPSMNYPWKSSSPGVLENLPGKNVISIFAQKKDSRTAGSGLLSLLHFPFRKCMSSDLAHAPREAIYARLGSLLGCHSQAKACATRALQPTARRRTEVRRGTQECVRHEGAVTAAPSSASAGTGNSDARPAAWRPSHDRP